MSYTRWAAFAWGAIQPVIDERTRAKICISSAVAVSIFASAKTAMLINWGECLAISLVGGAFNGSEWVSFLGPTLASIAHAILFVSVPPSHERRRGGATVHPSPALKERAWTLMGLAFRSSNFSSLCPISVSTCKSEVRKNA